MIDDSAAIEVTAFDWVPRFARGFVRDIRLRWACEEIGLPYRVRLISAMDRPDCYYDEQPWGQVPVMRDGDVTIFESGACLLHLGEKDERLLAKSGQARAATTSWLFAALNSIEPFNFEMTNITVFSKGQQWAELRRPSLEQAMGERYDRLAAAMGGKHWLAGEFSIGDIMMATVLREGERGGLLETRPVLADYLERALARPAFKAALEAQLETFAENAPAEN